MPTFTGAGLQPIFDPSNVSRYLLIRFAPAADRTRIEHEIASDPRFASPTPASVPPEIDRLRQIGWLPTTLAALLATLAVLAVGHALFTAVRRRRRELALLKTLGFTRRQVHATIAWQATSLAAVGIAVGIPVGLLLGTLRRHRVANNLGVTAAATVPTLAILLTIPIALALINLLAYLPGREQHTPDPPSPSGPNNPHAPRASPEQAAQDPGPPLPQIAGSEAFAIAEHPSIGPALTLCAAYRC